MSGNDVYSIANKIGLVAQIQVDPNANPNQQKTYTQSGSADYLLGYAAIASVATIGFMGLWLKKYFETRLEISIERQREEFLNAKEDRDRAQAQLQEDRSRSQKQADIFLTTTLSVIKEEKDSYLQALEGIKIVLEKIDHNQVEIAHQVIELKGETAGNSARIANVQNTISNIYGNTQQWEGNERRSRTTQ